jgi:Ca2+/Na+ antiporter
MQNKIWSFRNSNYYTFFIEINSCSAAAAGFVLVVGVLGTLTALGVSVSALGVTATALGVTLPDLAVRLGVTPVGGRLRDSLSWLTPG